MKLSILDQSFGETLRAEFLFVATERDPRRLRDRVVSIQRCEDGSLQLGVSPEGSSPALVVPQGRKADRFLDRIVDGGAEALVWVVDASPTHVTVQGHLLRSVRPIPQGLTVMLGPHTAEDLRPFGLRGDSLAVAIGDELALCQGGDERIGFLVALPSRPEERRFVIHGRRFNLEVRHEDGRPVVFRAVKTTQNRPVLTWLAGPVRFVEGEHGARCDDSTFAQLLAIHREGGYLERWRRYNDLERRMVVDRAKQRGVVRYHDVPRVETRDERKLLIFTLAEPLPEALAHLAEQSDQQLAALDRVQIEESGLSPGHYFSHWTHSSEERQAFAPDRQRLFKGVALGRPMLLPSDDTLLAVPMTGGLRQRDIPADGWLAVDLHGETVRLDRRERALSLVADHRARIPRLGEMLEGIGPRYGVARRRPVGAIATPGVLEAMKQTVINESQRRAIEIALRTPDIALILGPPGTGKTAVIRAIVRRLGELDRDLGVRTRVLLSAFQHDAVDEVLKDITLCGMSGLRIGGPRETETGSAEELRLAIAEEWARPRIEQARASAAALPEEPMEAAYRQSAERFVTWRSSGGDPAETRRAIAELEDCLRHFIDTKAQSALATAWRKQQAVTPARRLKLDADDERLLIERVAGLRCTAESFADDGPQQAERLHRFLSASGVGLDPTQQEALDQARRHTADRAIACELLDALAALQRELRAALCELPPTTRTSRPDPVAEAAMREAIAQAGQRVQRSQAGARAALLDFARALSADLPGLAALMGHYAQALGATCQQSVRAGVASEDDLGEHDVVIVDEAARANPLDLLIALVRGARLILVGDPNQLPHVLEKKVEDELEQDGSAQAREILQESLFQRLWTLCQQWQAEDGIPRAIQLNEQYRMHPELGAFVSRHFYERQEHDDAPDAQRAVENGIQDPAQRRHRFRSYEGQVAAWLDVSWRSQREKRISGSSSRIRPAEVEEIKRLVARLRSEDPDASIGVITFYKDQALRLARALGVGLGEGDKLRVGTVDAFQGRQFDAVILSTVRANSFRRPGEEGRTSRIGFLALRNRLCVALSRARCLLVVVGCKETVAGIPALGAREEDAAPDSACWQLTRFYEELCTRRPGTATQGAP